MHNLKQIRENPDVFIKKISDRNVNININELLILDKKNREVIQKKEKLEQEKKIISKKKDKTQFEKSKKISKEIETLDGTQKEIQKKINSILNFIPNIALNDVPSGKDDKSNKELKKVGITEDLIRLSIGIEDLDDLIKDINNALLKAFK